MDGSGFGSARDELKNRQQIDEQEYEFENDTNKSGMMDKDTMNVFGFNDDLELEDVVIV